MVEIKKKVHSLAFFIYNLKKPTSTHPTSKINSALATFMPLTIAAIPLFSRTKVVIINAI